MTKPDTSAFTSVAEINRRLDDIVGQVRNKDTSLERSLDLFDEAIALGSKAVDMVDSTSFTAEEEEDLRRLERASSQVPSPKEAPEA